MKIAATATATTTTALIVAAIVGSASAFVAPVPVTSVAETQSQSRTRSQQQQQQCPSSSSSSSSWSITIPSSSQLHATSGTTKKSQSIPFVNCPPLLDGSMAGDVGFDPFNFAKSEKDLLFYRAAEIKHARLAMLAAAGWPISELLDRDIATLLGMPSVLDATGRVPSVLNGGMGKISPLYWGVCVLLVGAVDVYGLTVASKNQDYFVGDLQFDPLGLNFIFGGPSAEGQKKLQLAEIKNGRLAMLAITVFAFQEFATHRAIIDQTPILFHPIWDTVFGEIGTSPITHDTTTTILDNLASSSSPPDAAILDAASSLIPPSTTLDAATSAATEVPIPPVDAAVSATSEAASVVSPPPPVVDATASAAASSPPPPVDVVSAAPAPSVVANVDTEELIAAKKRIAELELKIANIGTLSQ
mmetsp:Transcript_23930/g.27373  ORF Transcript_23930/g.27373 Transcript_23930/m.27373 type:complete len:416 (-) Transcript_23930:76-1323(-)